MQYQFKTINPSFTNLPPRTYVNPQGHPQAFQQGTHQSTYQFRMEKPVSSTSVKLATGVQSFPSLQLNGQSNISEMKKRLDSLLKQTDNLAAHRQINFNNPDTKQLEANKYQVNRSLTSQKRVYPNYNNQILTVKDSSHNANVNQFQTNLSTVAQNNYKYVPTQTPSIKQETKMPEAQYNKILIDKPIIFENKNNNLAQQTTIKIASEVTRKEREENPQKINGVYYGHDLKTVSNYNKNDQVKTTQTVVKQQKAAKYSPISHNYSNSNLSYDGLRKNKQEIVNIYEKPTIKIASESRNQNLITETKVHKELNTFQLQLKIKQLQSQNGKLKNQKQNISDSRDFYRSQVSDQRKNLSKTKEEYESKIAQINKNKQEAINNKVEQIYKLRASHQSQIKNIHEGYGMQLSQLNKQIADKQMKLMALVKDVGNNSNVTKDISNQKQNELARQNQQLTNKLHENQFKIQELKNQLNSKNEHINLLNQTFIQLKTQIQQLKKFKSEVETEKYSNFDEILMTQMKTINDLKAKIEQLVQKNNQIQQKVIESQRRNDSLLNEINIIKLKHKSEINNIELENGILLTTKENTIGTLNKKIMTMEDKYKLAINEIKTKDEFFKQHLVGRTDNLNIKQYIQGVLMKYEQSFSVTREEQLATELEKALKKLQLYEKYA